jgi:hypothetical protein
LAVFDYHNGNLDFEVFLKHPELYDVLTDRACQLIDETRAKFLGEFADLPYPSLTELTKDLEKAKRDLVALKKLDAPIEIIEMKEEIANEIRGMISNKEYVEYIGASAIEYKKAHDSLMIKFHQSKEFKNILKEIDDYNEREVGKVFDLSGYEKDEDYVRWLNS